MISRCRLMGAVLVLLGGGACDQGAEMNKADVTSLVRSERSFAANARKNGIGPGFMSVLDAGGIVFQPGPVSGPAAYEDAPSSAAILAWEPVYAEIAASGDLGYTTGPWEYFADSADSEAVSFGEYISIWRRNATGDWRLVLDIGTFRDFLPIDTSLHTKTLAETGNAAEVEPDDLLMRDRALAARANTPERETVYAEALAADARLMRTGQAPKVGREEALAWLRTDSLAESTFPEAAFLSEAGDLGYVYGRAEITRDLTDPTGAIAHGGYARIWRRSGDRWQLVLDVLSVRPGDLAGLFPNPAN